MSRYFSHLATAEKIITGIKNGEPLQHQLKKYFAADKKFGSKDRKSIAALCYNFYRTAIALPHNTIAQNIIIATHLIEQNANAFLEATAPELNKTITNSLKNKLLQYNILPSSFFTHTNLLSEEIDAEKFALSFLKQPLFFLRIRPGKEKAIFEKLAEHKIIYDEVSTSCIALPQGFKTDELMVLNKEVVVQDRSSQLVFDYVKRADVFLKKDIEVWDCCAASGGKSILLHDILHGHVHLQVTDVRPSILNNLKLRFKEAGIKNYTAEVTNLQIEKPHINKKFDLIICDAPCSGSGTWARTPEQLHFFKTEDAADYNKLQKEIAENALPFLQPDGLFFYITCSVFKQENEAVVGYLKEKFHVQILHMEYLKGYETQADTMFVAVLSF